MTKVAVIIVTYDGARFIDGCFGTLARMDRGGFEVSTFVIDNASKDDTVARLKAYPWITLIESDRNLGFAGGNNLAMRRALDSGCEFVYLLNHDTEVEPDFLVQAVRAAESDRRIGSVQSLLLLSPEKDLVNSAGNAVHFLGFGYCLGYRDRASSVPREGFPEIAYASGAGVLLRASALRKVGLFDDEFFMYHEDLDLGWRIRLAGMKNVLASRSVVYHKYEFSRSIGKYYYMERNRWLVFFRNFRAWSICVLLLPMLAAEVGLLLASMRSGWWREKLRSYAYFFRPATWRRIAAARADVTRIRTVSDHEIVRLFVPTITYQEVAGPFTRYVANPLMRFAWSVLRLLIV
jgi:GT2 family glycosyltransferase